MTFSQNAKFLAAIAAASLIAIPANAEDEPNGWVGEGSLSAGLSTGNTETLDAGFALKGDRDTGLWTFGGELAADYSETDEIETRNRLFVSTHLDRQLNDRLFAFGSASHERDEFSGFEERTFVGGGLGYEIFQQDALNWSVRGGPGYKIDKVEAELDETTVPATVLTPAMTEKSISFIGESNFHYDFNDNVGFSNDSKVLYAQESTQLKNITALTSQLNGSLSARVSFEVRHDTNPPLGFEATDTVSRVALVYGFGK